MHRDIDELADLSAIAYLNSDEFLALTGRAQYQKQVKEVRQFG